MAERDETSLPCSSSAQPRSQSVPCMDEWSRSSLRARMDTWRSPVTLRLVVIGFCMSCQRMASPPCPADAAPLRATKPANQRTTAAYFPSVTQEASSYGLALAAADLAQYRETPLFQLAGHRASEAYRVLTTGPLGTVVTLRHDGGSYVRQTATRRLCEDSEFGVATAQAKNKLTEHEWTALSSCMQHQFWTDAAPDKNRGLTIIDTWSYACGPGGHESSCVGGSGPLIMVEGVRNGEHLVRFFDERMPVHAGVGRCLAFPPSP